MTKYVALLRGINVSGHKKFLKAEQFDMLRKLDFNEIEVYLHTGNWLFRSAKKTMELEAEIFNAIQKKFGWQVPILVRSISEIDSILKKCPFPQKKKEQSYFILLKSSPAKKDIETVSAIQIENEEFHITQQCVYIYYKNNAGTAKLTTNWFERKLKVEATARNFRTMSAIKRLA